MSSMLEKLKEFMESDEGKRAMDEWAEKNENQYNILVSQLERFHAKFGNITEFDNILTRIMNKYNSDFYRDKWYGIGIEPPENLYWFLFEYAKKYGRKCTDGEWEKYSNIFTSELYFVHGYFFNRMDGQGSIIKISKSDE